MKYVLHSARIIDVERVRCGDVKLCQEYDPRAIPTFYSVLSQAFFNPGTFQCHALSLQLKGA